VKSVIQLDENTEASSNVNLHNLVDKRR